VPVLKIKGIIINGSTQSLIGKRQRGNHCQVCRCFRNYNPARALPGVDTEKGQTGNLKEVFKKSIIIDEIIAMMDTI